MGFPVVLATTGGLPVTQSNTGAPAELAPNGYGVAVNVVDGALPLAIAGVSMLVDGGAAFLVDDTGRLLMGG